MKVTKLVLIGLASLMMASSVQANFFSWSRNDDNKEKIKNTIQDIFNKIKDQQPPQRIMAPKLPDLGDIWKKLCGDREGKWNFERERDQDHFGEIMKKFKKICGDRPDVNDFCEKIIRKENVYHNGERYCPRPPSGGAVPEPSTYGLIGAGALLGLVAMRRFKRKAPKN